MTIIVVCDSKPIGKRLVDRLMILKRATVIGPLKSSGEALLCIAAQLPAVVIVDAQLEAGAGMKVLRTITKRTTRPLMVSVSTSTHQQYKRQSMKEGADYYFQLPDDIEHIAQLVEDLQ